MELEGRRPGGKAEMRFTGGVKADMGLVCLREDDAAEDLEGHMVAGEKHLRLGR